MDEQSIGILISRKEWNRLIREKSITDESLLQYVKKGDELKATLILFPINKVIIETCTTEGIIIKDHSFSQKEKVLIPSVVYNPCKFNQKKNKKKLRELSQHADVQVINEHHGIRRKHFLELISSDEELADMITSEGSSFISPFTFYILGQKDSRQKWQIPIIYAKDARHSPVAFKDAYEELFHGKTNLVEVSKLIKHNAQKVFHLLTYYYPGVFEIGIQFQFSQEGQFFITSTCPATKIKKDLYKWEEALYKSILDWPIQVAYEMKQEKEISGIKKVLDTNGTEEASIIYTHGFLRTMDASYREETIFWARIKPIENDESVIWIPSGIEHAIVSKSILLQFGVKELTCRCSLNDNTVHIKRNSFHSPIEISISTSVLNKMYIPTSSVYQVKFKEDALIIGPSIGFVLGERNQLYTPEYMEKYSDRFGEYERFGGLVIAFSARSVDWENKIVYGLYYDYTRKAWKYGAAPIPSTLYRRNFHQNEEHVQRLKELTNHNFFNSHFFKKSDLCLLQNEPAIKGHHPPTRFLSNLNELIDFTKANRKVILKPVSLSRGRGIYILEIPSEQEGYILYDYRNKFRIRHLISNTSGLQEIMKKLNILGKEYLFQKYIPLLRVEDRPFDVRVVMQKLDLRKWKCTGIECRIAGENEELTNIARGGRARTLEEIISNYTEFSPSRIQKKIIKLCHRFCHLMERKDYHFAEFGLDIALDEEGYPWILEANIFPSFKGFKEMDYETYLQIRYQPLFYSVQLQGFKTKEERVLELYDQKKSYL